MCKVPASRTFILLSSVKYLGGGPVRPQKYLNGYDFIWCGHGKISGRPSVTFLTIGLSFAVYGGRK